MIKLTQSLCAFGTPEFKVVLKDEISRLPADQLPLQLDLAVSNYALDQTHSAMIISVSDNEKYIHVKAGIFYAGIIAGCSCADDPTPIQENCEYCEVEIDIDKKTAESTVVLSEA